MIREEVIIPLSTQTASLKGVLLLPKAPKALVIFLHGSGSGRKSPRNQYVQEKLAEKGLAALLFDLLTEEEAAYDELTGAYRFNIPHLTARALEVKEWAAKESATKDLQFGYFGASTGASAALAAAAISPSNVFACVSRGGRVDLADAYISTLQAATLLIVGENDPDVLRMNQEVYERMTCEKRLTIVPKASHLFEEPGALETVADLSADWFSTHVQKR